MGWGGAPGTYSEVDLESTSRRPGRATTGDAMMRWPAVSLAWIRARHQKRVFQNEEWKNDPSKQKRRFLEALLIPQGTVTRALTSVNRVEYCLCLCIMYLRWKLSCDFSFSRILVFIFGVVGGSKTKVNKTEHFAQANSNDFMTGISLHLLVK